MAYTPILNALNELAKDGLVFKKEQNCQGLSLLKIYWKDILSSTIESFNNNFKNVKSV
jgi:hypothetical protein